MDADEILRIVLDMVKMFQSSVVESMLNTETLTLDSGSSIGIIFAFLCIWEMGDIIQKNIVSGVVDYKRVVTFIICFQAVLMIWGNIKPDYFPGMSLYSSLPAKYQYKGKPDLLRHSYSIGSAFFDSLGEEFSDSAKGGSSEVIALAKSQVLISQYCDEQMDKKNCYLKHKNTSESELRKLIFPKSECTALSVGCHITDFQMTIKTYLSFQGITVLAMEVLNYIKILFIVLIYMLYSFTVILAIFGLKLISIFLVLEKTRPDVIRSYKYMMSTTAFYFAMSIIRYIVAAASLAVAATISDPNAGFMSYVIGGIFAIVLLVGEVGMLWFVPTLTSSLFELQLGALTKLGDQMKSTLMTSSVMLGNVLSVGATVGIGSKLLSMNAASKGAQAAKGVGGNIGSALKNKFSPGNIGGNGGSTPPPTGGSPIASKSSLAQGMSGSNVSSGSSFSPAHQGSAQPKAPLAAKPIESIGSDKSTMQTLKKKQEQRRSSSDIGNATNSAQSVLNKTTPNSAPSSNQFKPIKSSDAPRMNNSKDSIKVTNSDREDVNANNTSEPKEGSKMGENITNTKTAKESGLNPRLSASDLIKSRKQSLLNERDQALSAANNKITAKEKIAATAKTSKEKALKAAQMSKNGLKGAGKVALKGGAKALKGGAKAAGHAAKATKIGYQGMISMVEMGGNMGATSKGIDNIQRKAKSFSDNEGTKRDKRLEETRFGGAHTEFTMSEEEDKMRESIASSGANQSIQDDSSEKISEVNSRLKELKAQKINHTSDDMEYHQIEREMAKAEDEISRLKSREEEEPETIDVMNKLFGEDHNKEIDEKKALEIREIVDDGVINEEERKRLEAMLGEKKTQGLLERYAKRKDKIDSLIERDKERFDGRVTRQTEYKVVKMSQNFTNAQKRELLEKMSGKKEVADKDNKNKNIV